MLDSFRSDLLPLLESPITQKLIPEKEDCMGQVRWRLTCCSDGTKEVTKLKLIASLFKGLSWALYYTWGASHVSLRMSRWLKNEVTSAIYF